MALTQIKSSNITDGTIVNADVSASAAIASTKLSGVESGLTSVQTFTSSGICTRPTGITKVIVEVQGGGSSGAGATSGTNGCNGGGGGGYAKKFIDVSSVTGSVITVGAGGAAQTVTGDGNVGGDSSWVDTGYGGSLTLTGGGGASPNQTAYSQNGAGGTGTNGDINIQGGDGGPGNGGYLGLGGSSVFGSGGSQGFSAQGASGSARGYGAGGGGGNGVTSGAGTGGIVIVWEYKQEYNNINSGIYHYKRTQ